MQANNQGLEVIYVSLDRNRASFDEYYGTMPWYTIPYEDDARVRQIQQFSAGPPTLGYIREDIFWRTVMA